MSPDPYADRAEYRALFGARDLQYFRVTAGETDLCIGASRRMEQAALRAALEARGLVEAAIAARPRFLTALEPISTHGSEPPMIRAMLEAGHLASVGPMAAVAGAVAGYVGRALRASCREVVVENGGDVFLAGSRERVVALIAGESELSGKLGVRVCPGDGLGICTSSGTVGHSLSFGHADAAMVLSPDPALADAAATRLGNLIQTAADLTPALREILEIPGILGALAVFGDQLAIQGQIELTALRTD